MDKVGKQKGVEAVSKMADPRVFVRSLPLCGNYEVLVLRNKQSCDRGGPQNHYLRYTLTASICMWLLRALECWEC